MCRGPLLTFTAALGELGGEASDGEGWARDCERKGTEEEREEGQPKVQASEGKG